jgi:hypothetical protein
VGPLEYILASIDAWPQYLGFALLFLMLHLPLMRRWAIGFYDPLLVLLFSGAMSCTAVAFMFIRGDVAPVYALSFTTCQLAYYAGLGIGGAGMRRPPPPPSIARPGSFAAWTLAVSAVAHICATAATWAIVGIPLFRASRLGAFAGSGGLGILERLSESSGLIALFSVVYLMASQRRLRLHAGSWLFLIWYLVSVALSGSKGAFLSVLQAALSAAFVYTGLRYQRNRFWGGRPGMVMIGLAVVFAVAVLATQEQADLVTAMVGLLIRIVSYADIYVFAYPDGLIEQLQGNNALVAMFGGFLSTLRLFPETGLEPHIGLQFTGLVFPDLDIVAGPNPQHAVFGYHYFGLFAPLYSLLLGLLTAAVQRNLYHRRHFSFLGGLTAFLAYLSLVDVSVDFGYALSKLASALIGGTLILGLVVLLHPLEPLIGRRPSRGAVGATPTA